MDGNEKRERLRSCGTDGCTELALIFSEPPRCCVHIENLDAWFADVLSETIERDVPESARNIAEVQNYSDALVAHDIYRNLLLDNPLGQNLYADFKNRVDPRGAVSFSFDDIVYFALVAAG